MSELSGRELDRAIAEALGWTLLDWRCLVTEPCPEPVQRLVGPNAVTNIPRFHASVDALKAVEPEGKDISLSLTNAEGGKFWVCTIWDTIKCDDGFNDYDVAAEAEGATEPEARARALLAWLNREKKDTE